MSVPSSPGKAEGSEERGASWWEGVKALPGEAVLAQAGRGAAWSRPAGFLFLVCSVAPHVRTGGAAGRWLRWEEGSAQGVTQHLLCALLLPPAESSAFTPVRKKKRNKVHGAAVIHS